MHKKISVSIIIVYYKVKKELFDCLKSINKSKSKVEYEIIVVDNDDEKTIENDIKRYFPDIIYAESDKNSGFGAGNNLGANFAKGSFLFFLNPDTEIKQGCIDELISFIQTKKNIGIVAPVLLDQKNQLFHLQGARVLTPFRAIFSLSFIYKFFPKNKIAKEYYLNNWEKKDVREVDVIPGTAFMIRKDVFKKIGGFDERFFLFFEEHDLCLRVQALRYKIFMIPTAQIVHLGGQSTKHDQKKAEKSFRASRFLYFRKHFGLLKALIVTMFLKW